MELIVGRSWIAFVAELLVLQSLAYSAASQSTVGFLSIDCGGPGGLDPITKLEWENDGDYLQASTQLRDEGVVINATVSEKCYLPRGRPVDNEEQLKTAMVFYPKNYDRIPRSKYCYKLPLSFHASEARRNYLLRATFPCRNFSTTAQIHGEKIDFNAYSSRFYLTVDSTYVSTVDLDESRPQFIELIIIPLSEIVYVCLVPLEDRSSMPAISGLELRPFNYSMYPRSYQYESWGTLGPKSVQASYLILFSRQNFGGDPNSPSLRYPDDIYDRLWFSPNISSAQSSEITFARNRTALGDTSVGNYQYPTKMFSTAWVGKSLKSNISFLLNLSVANPQTPTPTYYMHLLFMDIVDSSNDSNRYVDVKYDPGNGNLSRYFYGAIVSSTRANGVYHKSLTIMGDNVTFTMIANRSSDLPPMINGVEFLGEFDAVIARTATDDAEAIANFSEKIFDKSGDPCLPIPWAWIVCSMELPPRVTHINVTNKGLDGAIPLFFERLDSLTVLDLSNNGFRGDVPLSFGEISLLRQLNLESNKLFGELPPFRPQSFQKLEILSLANNQLSGNLYSLLAALDDSIYYLKLGNNSFTGLIPPDIRTLTNLQNLDLSANKLSGNLNNELLELENLQNLNLKDNDLQGTVPDSIWSSRSLQDVNLEQNKFTVLNLTTWYWYVTNNNSFDKCQVCRKVRLGGNPIQDIIIPSLESSIQEPSRTERQHLLDDPIAFILLGKSSSWCKEHLERSNPTLIERYLCRSDQHEDFWLSSSKNDGIRTKTLIIIGVLSGLVALVMVCVFAYFLWRLRRRTHELHQIQEALAKENVKPPFYDYEDLKTASHNFSSSSVLGVGGFGTVYKAELSDGTVVAVKKLISTEENTSDFLKEVVNITGIKHRHLIQLKGCCVKGRQQMLIYEYAENKNLAEALWGPDKSFTLNWKQRFNICLGIARGLAYLHEELQPKMVHRDIKPQNILLDKDYNAKIADFGLVRPAHTDKTQITFNIGGTRGYCSPEYTNEGMLSEKLDVYSFGVVLFEIVSGRVCIDYSLPPDHIFLRNLALELYDENKLLNLVDKDLMREYNEEEVSLVLQTALACCQFDPKKRPTMTQVVNRFMKHEDVAINIVRELKGRNIKLDDILEHDIDMTAVASKEHDEAEESCLLVVDSSAGHAIELSDMRPR